MNPFTLTDIDRSNSMDIHALIQTLRSVDFATVAITPEFRRTVCVHEAAHAVVNALGGMAVYELQVAPAGMADWVPTGRKGAVYDAWGLCCTSDPPASSCMRSDEFGGVFFHKAAFENLLQVYRGEYGARAVREFRRQVRAYICGTLAGPIAEGIAEGEEPNLWPEDEESPNTDITFAAAMADMLPGRWRAYWRMVEETRRVLGDPDVWGRVLRIADELERTGTIEYGPFLADALPPPRAGWPPARPA